MSTEFSVDEIGTAFSKLIDDEKINWAELNEASDLYALCDKVSAQFGGLPDSMLKTAMLTILERNLHSVDSEWLREHLLVLIVTWQREVANERPFLRPSQVVMSAPSYDPLPRVQRKRTSYQRQNGRMMLGVGALLQSVTEEPLPVEQAENCPIKTTKPSEMDEIENLTFEGNELSWEFWSKVSNSEPVSLPTAPKNVLKTLQMEHRDYKKWKKAQHEKRMGRKKRKFMDAVRREMEEFDRQEEMLDDDEETPVLQKKKDMEEGEIDSEEEKLERKRRKRERRNSVSSGSSDSSDNESGGEESNSRRRRSLMRKNMPRKSQTAVFNNEVLVELYAFRHRLFKDLPLKQKKNLVKHFNQVIYGSST